MIVAPSALVRSGKVRSIVNFNLHSVCCLSSLSTFGAFYVESSTFSLANYFPSDVSWSTSNLAWSIGLVFRAVTCRPRGPGVYPQIFSNVFSLIGCYVVEKN